jgi:hypothetical protein
MQDESDVIQWGENWVEVSAPDPEDVVRSYNIFREMGGRAIKSLEQLSRDLERDPEGSKARWIADWERRAQAHTS